MKESKILILDRYNGSVIYEGDSALDARRIVSFFRIPAFLLEFERGEELYNGHMRTAKGVKI